MVMMMDLEFDSDKELTYKMKGLLYMLNAEQHRFKVELGGVEVTEYKSMNYLGVLFEESLDPFFWMFEKLGYVSMFEINGKLYFKARVFRLNNKTRYWSTKSCVPVYEMWYADKLQNDKGLWSYVRDI